jgi:hypothetical protein
VSEQKDKQDITALEQVNAELSDSLDRCRALLRDCRTKLAANSNDEDGEESEADSIRG